MYGRKLAFKEGNLFIFVSEYSMNAEIIIEDPVTGQSYQFSLEKERSVLFATDKAGNLLATYRDIPIKLTSPAV